MTTFTESEVEDAALYWLQGLGWKVAHGPDIAPHAADAGDPGDRRIGVVWHTQGSGKSLTMAFYAGRIIREPAMENPTIRRPHGSQ